MNWDQNGGRVSRAYDEWSWLHRDQLAFLALGIRFANTEYDRIWTEAGEEPGDPDGPDLPDVFDSRVLGLWPRDFEWMHLSGVLSYAVTNFEVYLEKAREEVLTHRKGSVPIPEKAPTWRTLKDFFDSIDVAIETDDVKAVRDLRHVLAHRRGELRTEKLREEFAKNAPILESRVVNLSEDSVRGHIATLSDAVMAIDTHVYLHTWGR